MDNVLFIFVDGAVSGLDLQYPLGDYDKAHDAFKNLAGLAARGVLPGVTEVKLVQTNFDGQENKPAQVLGVWPVAA